MVPPAHDPCSTMLPPVKYVRPVSPVGPVSPERRCATTIVAGRKAVVVAHLELRVFTTATRIDARHHVGVGDTHHETNAPRGIGEHVGFHGFAAEGVDAVVDRYVPGDLERMTVDLDLALLHEAPTGLEIHRQEDVEPEGKFPFWIEGARIEDWRLASRRFICCVVIG